MILSFSDFTLYRIVKYHGSHIGTYFLRAYIFFYFGLCNSLVLTSFIIYLNQGARYAAVIISLAESVFSRGYNSRTIDGIYARAAKTNFKYSEFIARYGPDLDKVPLSREELQKLLFLYMGQPQPLLTMGGCPVCFQSLEGDIDVFTLPGCGHMVHKNCLLESISSSLHCPTCKRNIRIGMMQVECDKVAEFSPVFNSTLVRGSTLSGDRSMSY